MLLGVVLSLFAWTVCCADETRELNKRHIIEDPLINMYKDQELLLRNLQNAVIEKFNSLNQKVDSEVKTINQKLSGLASQLTASRQKVDSEFNTVNQRVSGLTNQLNASRQSVESEFNTVSQKITGLASQQSSTCQNFESKFNTVHQKMTLLGNQLNVIETRLKSITCPTGYVGENVFGCYKVSYSKKGYDAAKADCISDGAQLLAIESAEEMTKVIQLMDRINAKTDMLYWTGGKKVGGSWKWEGVNTPFTYTNWWPGHPRSFSSHVCLMIYYGPGDTSHKQWLSFSCTGNEYYICEI